MSCNESYAIHSQLDWESCRFICVTQRTQARREAGVTEFTGEVHPFAATFPMLDDESLKALAEDIAANGLLHPVVLDPDGVLVDGRNRLAACELAGIEPRFVVHAGDPVRFVVTANMQRRDLTQGQKAHLAVAADLDRKSEGLTLAAISGVSPAHIAQARVVARFAPHLTAEVIAGRLPHSVAYERAKAEKQRAETEARQLAEVQANAPDLIEKELPPDEAWAAYQARTKEQREREEFERSVEKKNRQMWADLLGLVAEFHREDTRGRLIRTWDGPPPDIDSIEELAHIIRKEWTA